MRAPRLHYSVVRDLHDLQRLHRQLAARLELLDIGAMPPVVGLHVRRIAEAVESTADDVTGAMAALDEYVQAIARRGAGL